VSHHYHAIHWNWQKRFYDLTILAVVLVAIVTFSVITLRQHPNVTIETLLMRSTSFMAVFLLQVLLCIGPLARLSPRFLPLLYNRRHLGITVFLCGLVHATIATIQHHALGDTFPLVSIFTSYANEFLRSFTTGDVTQWPFEPFGAFALLVLYLMAVTSHDFWQKLLGASLWKGLHLLIYPAYIALLAHVSLGFLQEELDPVYPVLVFSGFLLVCVVHLAASLFGNKRDRVRTGSQSDDPYVYLCAAEEIHDGSGKTVLLDERPIALFRNDNRYFAVSGICRHQGGPIGEGRILDGCITCPWHGWQYNPENGESPPPFDEHLPTFALQLRGKDLYIDPNEIPRGEATPCTPAPSPAPAAPKNVPPFYVGYAKSHANEIREFMGGAAVAVLMTAPLLMALLASAQGTFDHGVFEFGKTTHLEGVYYHDPLPSLYVTPDWPESTATGYHMLLCGFGKSGIPNSWSEHDGKKLAVDGTLIYRNEITMLEVRGGVAPDDLGAPKQGEERPQRTRIGPISQVGELVDTKCYLGVMRPATGKLHRACAIRCLSGGVPPSLLVRDELTSSVILLAGPEGKPLSYDVSLAGLWVRVEGTLFRENGFSFIRTESIDRFE